MVTERALSFGGASSRWLDLARRKPPAGHRRIFEAERWCRHLTPYERRTAQVNRLARKNRVPYLDQLPS
jgi:hypothetical protein